MHFTSGGISDADDQIWDGAGPEHPVVRALQPAA
jgi:hypothetical protein